MRFFQAFYLFCAIPRIGKNLVRIRSDPALNPIRLSLILRQLHRRHGNHCIRIRVGSMLQISVGPCLFIAHNVPDVVNGFIRDIICLKDFYPFRRIFLRNHLFQSCHHIRLLAGFFHSADGDKVRVIPELRHSEDLCQHCPVSGIEFCNRADVLSVPATVIVREGIPGFIPALRELMSVLRLSVHHIRRAHPDPGIQKRGLHQRAVPGFLPPEQRCQDSRQKVPRRGNVAEGIGRPRREVPGQDRISAAPGPHPECRGVVSRPVLIRP